MTRTDDVTASSVLVPAPGVHVTTLDDEKILYVAEHATLHHLDRAAALVWDCLLPPASISEIAGDLAEAFQADPSVVEDDVSAVLAQLLSDGALTAPGRA